MASSRCPEPEMLRAYALGEDVGAESLCIESHLVECKACQGALHNLAGFATEAIGRGPSAANPIERGEKIDFLLPAVQPDEIGRLANYRVLKVLGSGGMGIVFLAEDVSLERRVALKVMRPELHENPDGWKRFLREARTMAAIKHDHLVTIYQAGQERDVIYFAMELLEGESLETWMERHPRPDLSEVLRIGKELATGLAVLHQKGLIHRDVKPGNIWLEERAKMENGQRTLAIKNRTSPSTAERPSPHAPRVKILDLGLVRTSDEDARVTRSGTVIGTPAFMSPEQARGLELDARTDLFSMGGVLYSLCTGRPPFEGNSSTAVLMALAADTPPAVSDLNPEIPHSLSDLVMQLLERQPERRPASATEVVERLSAIEKDRHAPPARTEIARKPTRAKKAARAKAVTPAPSRWPWFVAAGAGLFVVLGVLLGIVLASSGWFSRPAVPLPRPGQLIVVDGDKVYLADLVPIAREHWPFVKGGPGPEGKGPEPKGKKKGAPPPPEGDSVIRFQGKAHPKGIFMHPPTPPNEGEPSSLTYDIGKAYKSFHAQVTLNDGPDRSEPILFSVFGDGKLLWKSRPLSSQAETQTCAIDIGNVQLLKIEARCEGPPLGAHAAWLDPVVAKAKP